MDECTYHMHCIRINQILQIIGVVCTTICTYLFNYEITLRHTRFLKAKTKWDVFNTNFFFSPNSVSKHFAKLRRVSLRNHLLFYQIVLPFPMRSKNSHSDSRTETKLPNPYLNTSPPPTFPFGRSPSRTASVHINWNNWTPFIPSRGETTLASRTRKESLPFPKRRKETFTILPSLLRRYPSDVNWADYDSGHSFFCIPVLII